MKKLIIDRKKWRRGFDDGETYLFAENGMCCLGFDAVNEGCSELEIKDFHEPSHLNKKIKGITKLGKDGDFENTKIAGYLMKANDEEDDTEDKREAKITKLFAKIGRAVELIK